MRKHIVELELRSIELSRKLKQSPHQGNCKVNALTTARESQTSRGKRLERPRSQSKSTERDRAPRRERPRMRLTSAQTPRSTATELTSETSRNVTSTQGSWRTDQPTVAESEKQLDSSDPIFSSNAIFLSKGSDAIQQDLQPQPVLSDSEPEGSMLRIDQWLEHGHMTTQQQLAALKQQFAQLERETPGANCG